MQLSALTTKALTAFDRAIPTPRYVRMPAVGFDLSDYTLKYLELKHAVDDPVFLSMRRGSVYGFGSDVILGKYGKKQLKEGVVVGGRIQDEDAFIGHLRRIKKQHNFSFTRLSLPEEFSYLFRTEIPKETPESQIRSIIEFQLKDNVPLAPEEAVFDYAPVSENQKTQTQLVDVSVYARDVVEQYVRVFTKAGMPPLSIEVEGQAIARSLVKRGDQDAFMIVDFGYTEAGLYIVENERLMFSASLDIGGINLTHAIQTACELTEEEAEKQKRTKGLLKTRENECVRNALQYPLSMLRDEIERYRVYWREHNATGGRRHTDICEIILSGGNANIVGLPEHLSQKIGIPVSRGDVWQNVVPLEAYVPDIFKDEAIEYATAIGLSMRSL